jgi:isoleucyl-tRNA synthetase
MKDIQKALASWSEEDALEFAAKGSRSVVVPGGAFELKADEVVLTAEVAGADESASEGEVTVALDTRVDTRAVARALARELASAVNQARRDASFALGERCRVVVADDEIGRSVLEELAEGPVRDQWLSDVRADGLDLEPRGKSGTWREEDLLEGRRIAFRVERGG